MIVCGGLPDCSMAVEVLMVMPRTLGWTSVPVLLRRPLPDVRSRRVAGLGRRLWTGWKGVLLLQSSILRHRGFCPHTVGKIRDIGEGVIVTMYGDIVDESDQQLNTFPADREKNPGN